MKYALLILIFSCIGVQESKAQAKTAKATATKSTLGSAKAANNPNGQVLDFEGEVIEGERKRPDLFLQISTKDLSFDSLLYLRNNYNDYLEVDRKGRNRFFRVKGK